MFSIKEKSQKVIFEVSGVSQYKDDILPVQELPIIKMRRSRDCLSLTTVLPL